MDEQIRELKMSVRKRLGGNATLLDVCQDVHMSVNGVIDPLPAESLAFYVQLLRDALAAWDIGSPQAKEFDDAVRTLIVAALKEYEERKK